MDDQKNINSEQENQEIPRETERVQVPQNAEFQENVAVPQERPSNFETPPPTIPQDTNTQSPASQITSIPVPDEPPLQAVNQEDNDMDAREGNVIEKPWVNAAEDIIKKDEGNPYLEEEDHEDLQLKYLKKRFGKEIKKEEE